MVLPEILVLWDVIVVLGKSFRTFRRVLVISPSGSGSARKADRLVLKMKHCNPLKRVNIFTHRHNGTYQKT
jgi:hypothetical protein